MPLTFNYFLLIKNEIFLFLNRFYYYYHIISFESLKIKLRKLGHQRDVQRDKQNNFQQSVPMKQIPFCVMNLFRLYLWSRPQSNHGYYCCIVYTKTVMQMITCFTRVNTHIRLNTLILHIQLSANYYDQWIANSKKLTLFDC